MDKAEESEGFDCELGDFGGRGSGEGGVSMGFICLKEEVLTQVWARELSRPRGPSSNRHLFPRLGPNL